MKSVLVSIRTVRAPGVGHEFTQQVANLFPHRYGKRVAG